MKNNTDYKPEYVFLDGKIVPLKNAKISVMAPGFTFAVSVFEGIRAYWNKDKEQLYIFRIDEHIKRLKFSMIVMELDLELNEENFKRDIIQLLKINKIKRDTYIRAQTYINDWGNMMSKKPVGSSIICHSRPRLKAYYEGKRFSVSSWRRNSEDSSPPRIKTSANYFNGRLAGLEALRSGFDGAIILNNDGTISEGPGGCIFIVRDNKLVTPSFSSGILESITRDSIINIGKIKNIETIERKIGRTELYLADEVFYCGTGQEIVPIISIDNKLVNRGLVGSITKSIQSEYDCIVRGDNSNFSTWVTEVY
ncbi:branched-chain amino acid transaminase [Alphaproteobacteria bacterium]|nr:branched-chain amino acid transaminase [Alphaproteobacteria bacterium]